jgi:hypothetical protein
MDDFNLLTLVLEVNIQAKPAKRILDVFEVEGVGSSESARGGQFRDRLERSNHR